MRYLGTVTVITCLQAFGNWINAGAKEGLSPSTGCEELRTDMFVSCERVGECMMTSLICPRTYPPHTSRNSTGVFVSSNVTVRKEKSLAVLTPSRVGVYLKA